MRDLLYALLLQSANDAAVALADDVVRLRRRVRRLMNARATAARHAPTRTSLARTGSTTAGTPPPRDLATLTRAAIRTPGSRTIVATRSSTDPRRRRARARAIQNRERAALAVSGSDRREDGLHVAAAASASSRRPSRDGRRLVAVVLGAPGRAVLRRGGPAQLRLRRVPRPTVRAAGERWARSTIAGGPCREAASGLTALVPRRRDGRPKHVLVDRRGRIPAGAGRAGRHARRSRARLVIGPYR